VGATHQAGAARARQARSGNQRRRTPKWVAEADAIQAAIAKQPDLTLSELKAELQTSLSRTSLCRALQQLRLTLKKKS
jgi:transposase